MSVKRQDVATQARKLRLSVENERWTDAADALDSVAQLAQELRKVEVSLLAQSLRVDLGNRMQQAEGTPFSEVSDRFEALAAKLDHLHWAAGK